MLKQYFFLRILALKDTTDNRPESFHRGVLPKLPPKKGNLNEWIDALADENIRQNNKYVQAADGKKSYEPKPAQKKHYQNLKWKAEQWGKIGVIPYLEQFAYHLSMPTEGLERPIFDPSTPTTDTFAI